MNVGCPERCPLSPCLLPLLKNCRHRLKLPANISAVDPWFNFRATKYLVQNGFYNFWDWFDDSKNLVLILLQLVADERSAVPVPNLR